MQIGVGLSLPLLATRRSGGFSPASLFTSGVAGAWYDPSDYSTLFQDSAGTTPVTAVEQPVGLMLDKSQGLVLGSELVTGAASAYTGNGTVATVGDTITATCTTNGIYGITFASTFVSNLWVLLTVEVVTNSASKSLLIFPNGNSTALAGGTTTGNKSFIALVPTATGSTRCPIFYINGLVGESFSIRLTSIKSIPGNHASQATAASRPVLRARYNLLTYSEQFDNAAWSKGGITVTANQTTAPDGTNTADLAYPATSGAARNIYQQATLASAVYNVSVYAKASGKSWIAVGSLTGSTTVVYFNVSSGTVGTIGAGLTGTITSVGNEWYRCTVSNTAAVSNPYLQAWVVDADGSLAVTANGTDGIYIWGADLRTGSSAGTYQRIAAATDYATAGFLPYLYFITDDSFGTNSIDFSATDKMSVCAGLTKLSDASIGTVIESSASAGANNGTFAIYAPNSPNQYTARSAGTATGDVNITSGYAAPITNVLTMLGDISGDSNKLRINGTQVGQSTVDEGTGNYLAYPLYIGRRNNATFPFNGNLYQLIVCGKALSASELASTEAYVATKTGVTI